MGDHLRSRGAALTHCWICNLREQRVCASFGIQEMEFVNSYKNIRTIRAGSDLFGQGSGCSEVYNLHLGWVFTYLILEDGRRQILSFGLRGGLYGLFPQQVSATPFGCQALSDVTVCAVPRSYLLRMVQERPELGLQLAWLGKRDEMLLYEHLTSIGRRSARERVAYLLLELFCRVQQRLPDSGSEVIGLPLNQAHIADAMGLTSIHVSRTLKGLREDGILQLKDGVLEIFDAERLFEVALVDVETARQWLQDFSQARDISMPAEDWMHPHLSSSVRARVPHRHELGLHASTDENGRSCIRR